MGSSLRMKPAAAADWDEAVESLREVAIIQRVYRSFSLTTLCWEQRHNAIIINYPIAHFAYRVCKHKQGGCSSREEGFRADLRQVWTAHGADERPLRPFSDDSHHQHRGQIRNDRADICMFG